MAEVKGLCDICGKARKLYVCWRCGRRVCEEHFDKKTGLCIVCLKKGRPTQGRGGGQFVIPESEQPISVSPGDVKK